MSKFIATNNVKDKLKCPKCSIIFYKLRHRPVDVVCNNCGWDGSFDYPDEQGEQ